MINEMKSLTEDLRQIARCCYYAKSFNPNSNVIAQIDQILKILKVKSSREVGLSDRVQER
jgi:hypothetical protein